MSPESVPDAVRRCRVQGLDDLMSIAASVVDRSKGVDYAPLLEVLSGISRCCLCLRCQG